MIHIFQIWIYIRMYTNYLVANGLLRIISNLLFSMNACAFQKTRFTVQHLQPQILIGISSHMVHPKGSNMIEQVVVHAEV